ncbi:hypothetical protein D3C79_585450 [compost metagenome]
MVVPAPRQGRFGHVQVHHLLSATGNRCHGKAAGISEQVQHALARRLLAHPTAAIAHVEEQAIVLPHAQVQQVGQAVLDHFALLARLAQQPLARAVGQVAVLDDDRLPRPLRTRGQAAQHGFQFGELAFGRLTEQGDRQHALQPVDGDLLQALPAAAAAVKQAAGFLWGRVEGGKQVLLKGVYGRGHGGSQAGKKRHSTLRASSRVNPRLQDAAPSGTTTPAASPPPPTGSTPPPATAAAPGGARTPPSPPELPQSGK